MNVPQDDPDANRSTYVSTSERTVAHSTPAARHSSR